MPPSTALQTKADADRADFIAKLKPFQSTYWANNRGKYCQILPTHTVIPEDGVKSAIDRDRKPHDQDFSLRDSGIVVSDIAESSKAVHVYTGGYFVEQILIEGGVKWIIRENFIGPDSSHNKHGWTDYGPG